LLVIFRNNLFSSNEAYQREPLNASPGKCGDIAIYDHVALVPPSNVPVYTNYSHAGMNTLLADYTGVPTDIAGPLKCAEDPETLIIDRKYTIMTNCAVAPNDMPDKIGRVTPALVAAMAGVGGCAGIPGPDGKVKTQESVWEVWKDLTPIVVGSIIETTRETNSKLIKNYVDKDMTDAQIDAIFQKEVKYFASLPPSKGCIDTDDRCKQWALNNDCIINPTFMLKYCPSSCNSCGYTDAQVSVLNSTLDTRALPDCANHGGYSTDPNAKFSPQKRGGRGRR
jgi:hypothetical protein